VRPSFQPSSRRRCTKAAVHWLQAEDMPGPKNPITGVADCCARAASGQATAAPPSREMNSRRSRSNSIGQRQQEYGMIPDSSDLVQRRISVWLMTGWGQ
jgi:hypothetical protein